MFELVLTNVTIKENKIFILFFQFFTLTASTLNSKNQNPVEKPIPKLINFIYTFSTFGMGRPVQPASNDNQMSRRNNFAQLKWFFLIRN